MERKRDGPITQRTVGEEERWKYNTENDWRKEKWKYNPENGLRGREIEI